MDLSSPVTTALIENITGTSTANVPKEVLCEVCKLSVSSYVVLLDHRAGRKHKNQLALLIRTRKINLHCMMCGHLSKNFEEWELHVTSETHVEKLKKQQPSASAQIPPPTQLLHQVTVISSQQQTQVSSNIPPLLPSEELKDLTDKYQSKLNHDAIIEILTKDKGKDKDWNCDHCNVKCQSQCSWDAHLASHKHRKNKHKFRVFPGITKDFVKKKYQSSFVRAAETIGNEFIEDGVIFYCKRCDVRMQTKPQLEIHMNSNLHKSNHPTTPLPVADPYPNQNSQQYFNFESSSYGYGYRNWAGENHVFNQSVPQPSHAEIIHQQDMERQIKLVDKAKTELLARFPFYAINMQNNQSSELFPEQIPMPVEPPRPVEAPQFPVDTPTYFPSHF